MGRGAAVLAVFGSSVALIASCSLLVGTSDIDRGCGPGTKLCDGSCVDVGDPAYGCDPVRCEPCHLDNAIPSCDGQICVVAACLLGFGCSGPNGCEANVFLDDANCGQCRRACADNQSCQNGDCVPTP